MIFFASLQDVSRKHVTIKYSKYGLWQQNAAQRLRRGIPAILRSRKHRPQTEKKKRQEPANVHKRLITLPSKRPPLWHPTEDYVSHKWRLDSLHKVKRVGDQNIIFVMVHYILPPSHIQYMLAFFQSLLLHSSTWTNKTEIRMEDTNLGDWNSGGW